MHMKRSATKDEINVTIALCMMRRLYKEDKISKKVYQSIVKEYESKGLASVDLNVIELR